MVKSWKTVACEDIAAVIVYDAWEAYSDQVSMRMPKRKLRAMVERRCRTNPLCNHPETKAYVEEYLKNPSPF